MDDLENAVMRVYDEAVSLMWKAIEEGHIGAGKNELALCDAIERAWPDAVKKAKEGAKNTGV